MAGFSLPTTLTDGFGYSSFVRPYKLFDDYKAPALPNYATSQDLTAESDSYMDTAYSTPSAEIFGTPVSSSVMIDKSVINANFGFSTPVEKAPLSPSIGEAQVDAISAGQPASYGIKKTPDQPKADNNSKTSVELSSTQKAKAFGALIQAAGAVYAYNQQMKAQSAVYAAQSKIASDNAQLMQMGVEYAYRRGETEMAAVTQKYAQIKANQRTAYAARGVALGVGSTAEVAASSQLQKEVDVITTKQNALAAAWGYKRQKLMYEATAAIDKNLSGKYARWAGFGLF